MSTYAQIAGTELQGWAALLAKWEMADAYDKEVKRQNEFRKQATGEFNLRVPQASAATAQQQIGAGRDSRAAQYNAIQGIPLASTGPSGGDPRRQAAAAALMGGNRAALGGYSDWALQQSIANINTQRQLNQISDAAGGQARVYPYRAYEAQHSWDALKQAGQAISGLGGSGGDMFGGANQPQNPNLATGGAYQQQGFNQGYFPQGDYNMMPAVDPGSGYPSDMGGQYAGTGGWVALT